MVTRLSPTESADKILNTFQLSSLNSSNFVHIRKTLEFINQSTLSKIAAVVFFPITLICLLFAKVRDALNPHYYLSEYLSKKTNNPSLLKDNEKQFLYKIHPYIHHIEKILSSSHGESLFNPIQRELLAACSQSQIGLFCIPDLVKKAVSHPSILKHTMEFWQDTVLKVRIPSTIDHPLHKSGYENRVYPLSPTDDIPYLIQLEKDIPRRLGPYYLKKPSSPERQCLLAPRWGFLRESKAREHLKEKQFLLALRHLSPHQECLDMFLNYLLQCLLHQAGVVPFKSYISFLTDPPEGLMSEFAADTDCSRTVEEVDFKRVRIHFHERIKHYFHTETCEKIPCGVFDIQYSYLLTKAPSWSKLSYPWSLKIENLSFGNYTFCANLNDEMLKIRNWKETPGEP